MTRRTRLCCAALVALMTLLMATSCFPPPAAVATLGPLDQRALRYDGYSAVDTSTTIRAIDLAIRSTRLPASDSRHTYDSLGFLVATNAIPTPTQAQRLVAEGTPVRSALQSDAFHRAPAFVVDDIAENATVFRITGGDGVQRTLVQMPGAVDDVAGRFEWIVDDWGNITHQFFVKGGSINGIPITP